MGKMELQVMIRLEPALSSGLVDDLACKQNHCEFNLKLSHFLIKGKYFIIIVSFSFKKIPFTVIWSQRLHFSWRLTV